VVEGAPLLRAYGSKAHRGFESLPLRQFGVIRGGEDATRQLQPGSLTANPRQPKRPCAVYGIGDWRERDGNDRYRVGIRCFRLFHEDGAGDESNRNIDPSDQRVAQELSSNGGSTLAEGPRPVEEKSHDNDYCRADRK
jgi:hypothetical protein